jgi:APA family basic amino acid/polyamine antiporter
MGVKESTRANNIMVVIKLAVLVLFVIAGVIHLDTDNYTPFAPNGFRGIHQGAAIVFFAYIGFDAISTAAEETRDPTAICRSAFSAASAICTVIYVLVGFVLTGMVPYTELGVADPRAHAPARGLQTVGWIVCASARPSMTAVLLVFRAHGQPRIFSPWRATGCFRSGPPRHPTRRIPYMTTLVTARRGVRVAYRRCRRNLRPHEHRRSPLRWSAPGARVRVIEPNRPRPFKVLVWPVALLCARRRSVHSWSASASGLDPLGWWLAIGLAIYFFYGYGHSRLRRR